MTINDSHNSIKWCTIHNEYEIYLTSILNPDKVPIINKRTRKKKHWIIITGRDYFKLQNENQTPRPIREYRLYMHFMCLHINENLISNVLSDRFFS